LEIKVLKRTERELRLEVVGESHTLLNLLQKELIKDEEVELGGYDVVHPLERPVRSILYVRTKGGKSPEQALLEAVERARAINREFAGKFSRALELMRSGPHEAEGA